MSGNNEIKPAMAWQNLRQAINDLESGQGEFELGLATVMAGVCLMMEFPPAEVVEQVKASDLPDRATVSWLVYEAGRLKEVDQARVEALRQYWESICPPGQGILPPPPKPMY